MPVDVNLWAVLASGVSSIILGALWYGPLFSKQWISLSGLSQQQLDANKQKGMAKSYVLAFVGSLVMAYVLSHTLVFAQAYMDVSGISSGLSSGFWIWLGFIAPVTLGTVLWDGKPWKLWVLNNAFNLLSLLVMGAILALWV